MIFLVFKVSGFPHSTEQFIHEWALEPSHVWDEGNISPRGMHYKDSGFVLPLSNAESGSQAQALLVDFIESKGELFQTLLDLDAKVDLSIGVTLGEEGSAAPAPALEFPQSLLAEMGACGINMTITFFPATDEA